MFLLLQIVEVYLFLVSYAFFPIWNVNVHFAGPGRCNVCNVVNGWSRNNDQHLQH